MIGKCSSADRQTGTAVFSRILSPSGTVVDVTPDTIVDGPGLPGDGMRLRDAIAGGFIIQTAPGVYANAEASQEAAPEVEPEQNKDELGGEAIEQEAEAVLGNLVAGDRP